VSTSRHEITFHKKYPEREFESNIVEAGINAIITRALLSLSNTFIAKEINLDMHRL